MAASAGTATAAEEAMTAEAMISRHPTLLKHQSRKQITEPTAADQTRRTNNVEETASGGRASGPEQQPASIMTRLRSLLY